MYISIHDNFIKSVSDQSTHIQGTELIETNDLDSFQKQDLIGKKVKLETNPQEKLKLALICNWGDHCGIAEYTRMLVEHLTPHLEIKIFAEINNCQDEVTRNWNRGESMLQAIEEVLAWNPDIVHIQHEFGIFPKATYFLKVLELLDNTPYIVTTHSVYEHLDKTVCTSYIKNIIVHSEIGKKIYEQIGHNNKIFVIPHGCLSVEDNTELWNIFQNDYAIIQFGFGFNYKGVDQAIDALNHLKKQDKFKNIFYCYLCSENSHTQSVHDQYYSYLKKKIADYGMEENVVIMKGFLTEQALSNFLRTAKLALFPYKNDLNNCVYGASGAIRMAMANGIPIIASDSHLFDDLEGVLPRPTDYLSLAEEIDHMFSDGVYRVNCVQKNLKFVNENDWKTTAERHLVAYQQVIDDFNSKIIKIKNYSKIA